ncbi:MAG: sugar phosphate isomerase/epimerase family protein [Tangfeifania sp.]
MATRRNFIKTSSAGLAGITLGANTTASVFAGPKKTPPIHVFTKCLQFLSYDKMAEILAEHGFDGADLTVRPRGQVLPENVETDLPRAVEALKKNGIGTNMITTGISSAEQPATRSILKTMANMGIKYYRMGYLSYDRKKSVIGNLDHYKFSFAKLEKMNREYGVHGGYQNHSGNNVGAPVWDLYPLLKDRDPEHIGVQFDVRHATVEGALSWPLGMELLSPWIKTTDIKDFIWEKNEKGEWKVKNVPLGEGMVDFDSYFEMYKSFDIEAPVSIHYEYDLGGAEHGSKEPAMDIKEIESYLKKDLAFLVKQFDKFQ